MKPRLVFIDVVRALGVAMMVFAHVTDQLLDHDLHHTAFGLAYFSTRGFTAPLFFVVSGWSFALVMSKTGASRDAMTRRLRRAAELILWGYALTLPWWAEGFPWHASPGVWTPFWAIGVLGTLGLTIAAATLLMRAFPRRWVAVSAAAAVASIALATQMPRVAADWPQALRGLFDPQGVGGGFPIAPWAGFFFVGVVLGGQLLEANGARRAVILLAAAAAFGAASQALKSPHNLVLYRLAFVAGILALASIATARMTRVPGAVRAVSRAALSCYVVHMVVLWGAPFMTGLVHTIGPSLDWPGCLALSAACILLAEALGRLWAWAKARAREAAGLGAENAPVRE